MRLGWYLSGFGHVVLILGLLFGGLFVGDRIPEPLNVAEVAVISEQEFAALALPGVAPDAQSEAPDVAAPEPVEEEVPDPPEADSAPQLAEPDPVEEPPTPETPDITVPEPVVPNAVIVDTEPPVPAPPSEFDGTTLEPDAVAAPAPRVAPVPQVATPDTDVAPDVLPDTAPEPLPEPEQQPEPETPAAPKEASDRIVTEAEEVENYAPASSRRPRSRPPQPVQVAEPEPEPEETPEPAPGAIEDAVAAALSDTEAPTEEPRVRRGPPLSSTEASNLKASISSCWNLGALSTDAFQTVIVVNLEVDPSGKPIMETMEMTSFDGNRRAADQVFRAARSAMFRCGQRGLPLPPEKYEEWRFMEILFDPKGMQFR
ncbi:MAG: energy transducer TonB [Pseudomonadota bacterium]